MKKTEIINKIKKSITQYYSGTKLNSQVISEIKNLLNKFYLKPQETKTEEKIKKIKTTKTKPVTPKKPVAKSKHEIFKEKFKLLKAKLEKDRKNLPIAPEELTGISSQNIGETQHAESPQTSLISHIPLSNPAPNVSGSNAFSSMSTEKSKEKPRDDKDLTRTYSGPNTKQLIQSILDRYRDNKNNKTSNENIGKKERYLEKRKLEEELHEPDQSAIDYGGTEGGFSTKRPKREKNK